MYVAPPVLFCVSDADDRSLQLFTAIAPAAGGVNDAKGFFKQYLALPVVIFFYICGYIWKRQGWVKIADIDVDTGRRELPWDEINAYRAEQAAMPPLKRWFHHVFV